MANSRATYSISLDKKVLAGVLRAFITSGEPFRSTSGFLNKILLIFAIANEIPIPANLEEAEEILKLYGVLPGSQKNITEGALKAFNQKLSLSINSKSNEK